MPGRYFYRPLPSGEGAGLDQLGAGLANGISSGVENYYGEKSRMRQEGREDTEDARATAEEAWKWANRGEGGPEGAAPPPLDMGGASSGTDSIGIGLPSGPKKTPLGPWGTPAAPPSVAPTQSSSALGMGPAGLSLAGQPPAGGQGELPLPQTSTSTAQGSPIQDYLRAPQGRNYINVGGHRIEDPEDRAERQASEAFDVERGQTRTLADDAYGQAVLQEEQQARDIVPQVQAQNPDYTPEEAHAAALSIVRNQQVPLGEEAQARIRRSSVQTRVPPRDTSIPTYPQAMAALQDLFQDPNAALGTFTKSPEEMDAIATRMANGESLRDILGGTQETGQGAARGATAGYGSPAGSTNPALHESIIENAPPGLRYGPEGSVPLPGGGDGFGADGGVDMSGDPWEPLRAILREDPDPQQALEDEGIYSPEEIDEILSGL